MSVTTKHQKAFPMGAHGGMAKIPINKMLQQIILQGIMLDDEEHQSPHVEQNKPEPKPYTESDERLVEL